MELERAAQERIADADALLRSERSATAIAYGLYALEIQLKIAVCRRLDLTHLPRAFQIHDLLDLMHLTGLSREIGRTRASRDVKRNWDAITDLPSVDELRYGHRPEWNQALAANFLEQLLNEKHGVIPWLRKKTSKTS